MFTTGDITDGSLELAKDFSMRIYHRENTSMNVFPLLVVNVSMDMDVSNIILSRR